MVADFLVWLALLLVGPAPEPTWSASTIGPEPTWLASVLGAAPIAGASAATTSARAQGRDPLVRFNAWLKRVREGREAIDARSIAQIRIEVSDARTLWSVDPMRGTDIATPLLDLLGLTLRGYDPAAEEPEGALVEARKLAADALRAHIDSSLRDWMARQVLARASQPIERRMGAAWLAIGTHAKELELALLACTRDPDPRLVRIALEALSGWDDEAVHALFLQELTNSIAGRSSAHGRIAEEHFKSAHVPEGSREMLRLSEIVKARLSSTDWRTVSQAVALSKPLEHAAIVPFLIEAMATWKKRGESGGQAVRIEMEILHALEVRSGRKLGVDPESWRAWWSAVEKGEVRGQTPFTTGGGPEPTRASFFGLKPATDRVTFVLDKSGSMDTAFGPQPAGTQSKKHTRWDEAVAQLSGFVEAIGDSARFNVVIFHDYAEAWRPTLVDAGPENRKSARDWLLAHHPGGATELRSGIDRALMIDKSGSVDLVLLEADTVIVLCDGATDEGPQWVVPFMKRVNSQARVVFDCVEIGNEGDGTLPKLARESGGDYVRIDG
jgi:hypothetical protein